MIRLARAIPALLTVFLVCAAGGLTQAEVVSFTDYDAFVAAVGEVRIIDFDTLPDGSPSYRSVPITPEFNYGDQGVVFSAPIDALFITGNSGSGFGLTSDGYPDIHTWITATFADPAYGVGFIRPAIVCPCTAQKETCLAQHFDMP